MTVAIFLRDWPAQYIRMQLCPWMTQCSIMLFPILIGPYNILLYNFPKGTLSHNSINNYTIPTTHYSRRLEEIVVLAIQLYFQAVKCPLKPIFSHAQSCLYP